MAGKVEVESACILAIIESLSRRVQVVHYPRTKHHIPYRERCSKIERQREIREAGKVDIVKRTCIGSEWRNARRMEVYVWVLHTGYRRSYMCSVWYVMCFFVLHTFGRTRE